MPDKVLNADGSVVPIVELNTGAGGVTDSTGLIRFDPTSASHAYTYNGDGTLATDSATSGANTFLKTYSYTAGALTGETAWVKQ